MKQLSNFSKLILTTLLGLCLITSVNAQYWQALYSQWDGNSGFAGFYKDQKWYDLGLRTTCLNVNIPVNDDGSGDQKTNFQVKKDYTNFFTKAFLNDNFLAFRAYGDYNHGFGYNSAIDGMESRAYNTFIWTNGWGGATERMRLAGNGYLGINNNNPQFQLDVNGRSRFRSGNGSAGFWLSNSNNTSDNAFVGMEDDNTLGMYGIGAGWNFHMNVNSGNIGIGTSAPTAKLEVNGSAKTNGLLIVNQSTSSTNAVGTVKLLNNHNTVGDTWFMGFGTGTDGTDGNDRVRLQAQTADAGSIFSVISGGGLIPLTEKLRIDELGKVGIGTSTPTELLTVQGNIKCNSLIADATKFPDYVFDENYDLKTIDSVSNYIKINKRLPGMPSEAEVLKNGLNVNQVTINSVEKIEELYRYIFQLNEKMKVLEDKLEKANKN